MRRGFGNTKTGLKDAYFGIYLPIPVSPPPTVPARAGGARCCEVLDKIE